MKEKQLVSLTLILTLLLGLATPVFGQEETAPADEVGAALLDEEEEENIVPYSPFPDVNGHWAQGTLEKWHHYGVIGGDTDTGAFRPDDSISRAEFGTLLNRVMGYPLVEIKHFKDVPADAWYAETMSRLNSAGIIQGDGNDMVRPRDPLTRQEATVILCRAFGIEEQEANINFLDADQVSSWASGSVGALYNMGAIRGWEGYFNPQDSLTRVQSVILLDNLIGAAMTKPGTWNQDVKGDMYVNTRRAILENMTVSGDLIITAGVAKGDVTLSNVKVKGDLIVQGCGEKSLHIQPGFELEGEFVLAKTIAGNMRVVNETEKPLSSIHINAGTSTVILEGDVTSVSVGCNVPVILRKSKVETLSLSAPKAGVTVEKESTIAALTITKEAKDSEITLEGTVTTLTTNAAAKVNNTGKLSSIHVAASGLVLAGSKPDKLTVASGVARPKDGSGNTINNALILTSSSSDRSSSSSSSSSSGSSPSGSGGQSESSPSPSPSASPNPSVSPEPSNPDPSTPPSTPPLPEAPEELTSVTLTLPAPAFAAEPQPATAGEDGYTVSTVWQDADGSDPTYRHGEPHTFTADHVYQAVIDLIPKEGHHFAEAVAVTLNGDPVTPAAKEDGSLTFTKVFSPTEPKNFIENASLSYETTELEAETGQVTVSVSLTDNRLTDPTSYEYQWQVNGTDLENATDSTYAVTADAVAAAEGGYSLTCTISVDGYTPVTTPAVIFTVKSESTTPEEPEQPEVPNPPEGSEGSEPEEP